jgi:glycosyltransferase involved in cell wall biosynthesis
MPKLLFLVTEDWYFYSHRLQLAIEAKRKGYSVIVATRVQAHGERILAEGFKLIPIHMVRHSAGLCQELSSILELVRIYRAERPDIVHHVALKPVLLGSIAALFANTPNVINAIAGMGYIFSSQSLKARLLRPLIRASLKFLLKRSNTMTILQNPDDRQMLIQEGLVKGEQTKLIRGSGVDTKTFYPFPEPPGPPIIILASRMLWDKGIKEFIEAAQLLRDRNINARFILAGESDSSNLSAVPAEQLEAMNKDGIVEWWGKQDDMPGLFASSHIVCLPSFYGEGVPKVLIEAAACGRPIITTDWPGCREIVRHEVNGLLAPIKDSVALADSLLRLINDPGLRHDMGSRGRQIAVTEFSSGKVIEETLSLYKESLAQ